jgi:protein ImuA
MESAGAPHFVASDPRVFRVGDMHSRAEDAWPTGFAALDRELPGGGWPRAGLVEIAGDSVGIGELSLLLKGLAAAGARDEASNMLWILPRGAAPWVPYAPGLVRLGLALQRLAIVRAGRQDEALWAAEQALRGGAARAVLLWLGATPAPSLGLRRLQQAAMAGRSVIFAFRSLAALAAPSPALLRLGLEAQPNGILRIDLAKRRSLPAGRSVLLAPRDLPCLDRERTSVPADGNAWLRQMGRTVAR